MSKAQTRTRIPESRTAILLPAILLVSAVVIGGQADALPWTDMLLQLLAVIVGVGIVSRKIERDGERLRTLSHVYIVLLFAIGFLHLVPIPWSLWSSLNPSDQARQVLTELDIASGWRSYTLDPHGAFTYLLVLLPPVAMFLAVSRMGMNDRVKMIGIVVLLAVISALLGLMQFASDTRNLYFYDVTHLGYSVGFFANRNHHTDLLIVGLLLGSALFLGPLHARFDKDKLRWVMLATLVILMLTSILATGSRAGFALAVFAGIAIMLQFIGFGRGAFLPFMVVSMLLLFLLAMAAFSGNTLFVETLARFERDDELRFEVWPIIIGHVGEYMPFGTGIGSFVPVYGSQEPLQQVDSSFLNHAHNDYLEVALEAGIPGIILILLFIGLFALAAVRSVRLAGDGAYSAIAKMAAVGVVVFLGHAVFDYSLRTTSLSVVFALLCGLLMPMPKSPEMASGSRANMA